MADMSHRIASPQFAEYVGEHGGGSMNFHTGRMVSGPGFMVAQHGAETRTPEAPTSGDIQEFADRHYPSVINAPNAHLGVWGNVMDVSAKVSIGADARRAGRQHLQEAAYALGSESSPSGTPTRISATETTDSLNRPYGTDVLLNMGRAPKAEREAPRVVGVDGPRKRTTTQVPKRPDEDTPIYRDMADPSVQADPAWARSSNANDFNLNEVDNDAWSMTNRENPRIAHPNEDRSRRTTLGDVMRTIHQGRTQEARGKGLVAHETKGWHPKDAGASKIKPTEPEDERSPEPVRYTDDLERERFTTGEESPEAFRARNEEAGYAEAREYQRRASTGDAIHGATPEIRRAARNPKRSRDRLVPESRPKPPAGS